MARGRSTTDYERVYADGYDLSGYLSETGEHGVDWAERESLCLTDAVKGVLAGKPTVTFGPFNGVMDNTAISGLHVLAVPAQGLRRNIMLARGVMAAPAIGDDAFCAPLYQTAYKATQTNGMSTVNMKFSGLDLTVGLNYDEFFGALLHPMGSETAANTANTNSDNGAASSAGGWLMYQIRSITGTGTVTISVDDSANGTAWLALASATTTAIATATAPTSGIIQLATSATVRQYLRPQIAFGGSATACTYALAFMRGR